MEIYILFLGKLYYNSYITVVIICTFVNFFILPTGNNLMLATLIGFLYSSRNPNKEEEKPSEFLYLNPDDKLQSVLDFDEIIIIRFSSIGIGIDIMGMHELSFGSQFRMFFYVLF